VACVWLDGAQCEVLVESGMNEDERQTGERLGRRLADLGTSPESPVMIFYDALDCTQGVRVLMATWLLEGMEKGMGFLPDLTVAGLMGDHMCSPTSQWTGAEISQYSAIALAFFGDIRVDSVIMHGCRPATPYYTVTKAAGPVILEINGKPAISFVDELLHSAIPPESYPFYLIFGVNHGDPWSEYNEDYYASRLCLGIDKDSGGIVMFEPDMVEGTAFQLMFRTLEHDYIKPKIDRVFDDLDGREPVFAVYIDCAGRCSGYAGIDTEDAVVVQKAVADRVPLLGLYTGVEIASIGGRPRGLDWTGVFCLFSRSKDKGAEGVRAGDGGKKRRQAKPVWETGATRAKATQAPVEALIRLSEQNVAKILNIDIVSSAIRVELEQKRRSFSLLSELSSSLRHDSGNEDVFAVVASRVNSALNMQRTVVLRCKDDGNFFAEVLQGYTAEEKSAIARRQIQVPLELLSPDSPVCITGADPADSFGGLREILGLPFFVSTPILLLGEIHALLITGRLVEAGPYLLRLSRSDVETVQALGALLASVLASRRLAEAETRNKIMLNASPIGCVFWDENGMQTDCNAEALSLFGMTDKQAFLRRFYRLSPNTQPDGRPSEKTFQEHLRRTFVSGEAKFFWEFRDISGAPIHSEVVLVRFPKGENYTIAGYLRNLREQGAAADSLKEAREAAERVVKAKNTFLASVSHEIRTPMNAILAMARIAEESKDLSEAQKTMVQHGMRSVHLLTSAIETILDFSRLDSGSLALETTEFSIRDLVRELCGIVNGEATDKGLCFDLSVDPLVPEALTGDPVRVQQALFNIVINAIKFTAVGGVTIRIFNKEPAQAGKITVVFEVRDTGPGMGEEQIDTLFEPLTTGEFSYSRKHGGMGMGLPVSNGLAILMGGRITCESCVGEGSVFWLEIPFGVPEEKPAAAAGQDDESRWDALSGLRVLVAEDNAINQLIIEELLCAVGMQTTITDNGLETLEELETGEYDIILLDIMMPEMDGLACAARIRADRRFDNIPILAMTANAGLEHSEESIRAGMNAHLTKPLEPEQLYRALRQWCTWAREPER